MSKKHLEIKGEAYCKSKSTNLAAILEEVECKNCLKRVDAKLGPPLEPWEEKEVNDHANGLVTGTEFASWIGSKEFEYAWALIWMCVEKPPRNAVGLIGPISSALPRGINGLPIMTKGQWIPRESSEALDAAYLRKKELLKS